MESQHKVDWTAVRQAALECLNAAWDLAHWAERSQEDDYDVACAALHLAAIDSAGDTLARAINMFAAGLFDSHALASVGEGPRPNFQVGGVCCATAHETAFVLLRSALLWMENGLNEELDDKRLDDQCVASIDDLHELSPESLRDTLSRLGKRKSLKSLVDGRGTHQVRAWIDREWAAVSQSPARADQDGTDKAFVVALPADFAEAPADPPKADAIEGTASVLEWSKPIAKKTLQKLLGPISPNTLKSRLTEGNTPVTGKIRYQGPKGARKIQVVVPDLPADLQTRFRKSANQ